MELIKLKKEDLNYLHGYYTGHKREVLKNAENGIYLDPEDHSITIVTCGGNDGDYTQVRLSRGHLLAMGYLRNFKKGDLIPIMIDGEKVYREKN